MSFFCEWQTLHTSVGSWWSTNFIPLKLENFLKPHKWTMGSETIRVETFPNSKAGQHKILKWGSKTVCVETFPNSKAGHHKIFKWGSENAEATPQQQWSCYYCILILCHFHHTLHTLHPLLTNKIEVAQDVTKLQIQILKVFTFFRQSEQKYSSLIMVSSPRHSTFH